MKTFQEILLALSHFWEKQGCIIHQGYDLEVGAGTFNPATFLRCLGPEPYKAAYIEPSRRPSDGRYGENPIRFQHYFQFQVMLKPSPANILELYLESLAFIGFDLSKHDIRFVHDDWESPTLGASGLGWEVWMDGMEVTQFTYFQQVGGQELKPITGEITYGIERLATFLQGVNSTFELNWSQDTTYGDIYKRNEYEWSHYNFEYANTSMWHAHFEDFEKEAKSLIDKKFPLPAYDFVMKASHAFNLLDARGAISVSERAGYIARIRDLAKLVANLYVESRKEQGFPLLKRFGGILPKAEPKSLPLPEKLLNSDIDQDDFLLEVGVEELPQTFVEVGARGLEKALKSLLEAHQIPYTKISTYATPRRLAALIEGLALEKPAKSSLKRGPAVKDAFDEAGNPKPSAIGFFKSVKQDPLPLSALPSSDIKIQAVSGTDYLFANLVEPKEPTARILQSHLAALILGLDFPKKMRSGDLDYTFARPIRWLLALFGNEVLPFQIEELISSNLSYGHRQLSPDSFVITSPLSYLKSLKDHFVLADIAERKRSILEQLSALEKEMEGTVIEKEKVIAQVLHLVEWPTLTYSTFDERYLKAPKEILVAEMVEHQKYFPVADAQGNLKNLFVITANNIPSDLIRAGNQKVLSSRLKDGTFLFEQDLKIPLETLNEKLKAITFMKGLGSMWDKTERLKKHCQVLSTFFPKADPKKLEQAAHFSKVDLPSGVIYEFPELQGVMGTIYARHAHLDEEVAKSIDEHWMPRGESAPLPTTQTGVILSLADKIDNLISCFGLGLKPSSSSDPYALRRQVLGLIRILLQEKVNLPLQEVISGCIDHFGKLGTSKEVLSEEISQFILNRIRTVYLDYSFTKDEIEASLASGFNDIFDSFCRIGALSAFRKQSAEFPALLEVYKRAKGQIQSDKTLELVAINLKEPAEKELHSSFEHANKEVVAALSNKDYSRAFQHLATLKLPLAKLFDEVKILDDDPKLRQNRLALLQGVFGLFGKLIDFSKIQS